MTSTIIDAIRRVRDTGTTDMNDMEAVIASVGTHTYEGAVLATTLREEWPKFLEAMNEDVVVPPIQDGDSPVPTISITTSESLSAPTIEIGIANTDDATDVSVAPKKPKAPKTTSLTQD